MVNRRAGRQETPVSAVVLVVLAVIASGVLIRQASFDPALFRAAAVDTPSPASDSGVAASKVSGEIIRLQTYLPQGVSVLTPPEIFGSETLSDKIDGKAELYLSAGFVSLSCQRFTLASHPAAWLEVYVFDMGAPRNAFAVFSAQRRADGEALPLTRHAYRTANAVFFTHGRYYLEIVAAQADDASLQSILAYAASFVHQVPVDQTEVSEGPPFPLDGLDQASITLLASDVFGFDGLTQVYIATYQTTAGPMTAFISEQASEAAARALADSYRQFLVTNGGTVEPPPTAIPDASVVQLFDTFELVSIKGRYLLGVHDASQIEPALHLAQRLYEAIPENTP